MGGSRTNDMYASILDILNCLYKGKNYALEIINKFDDRSVYA